MADAQLLGLEKRLAAMRAFPAELIADQDAALKQEVDDLVEAEKRATPVSDLEEHPGQLRDSTHSYPTPDRPLSYLIIVDARAKRGDRSVMFGRYVQFGHIAANGVHVGPKPWFFETYRARKKAMRQRQMARARKTIRKFFPLPGA